MKIRKKTLGPKIGFKFKYNFFFFALDFGYDWTCSLPATCIITNQIGPLTVSFQLIQPQDHVVLVCNSNMSSLWSFWGLACHKQ